MAKYQFTNYLFQYSAVKYFIITSATTTTSRIIIMQDTMVNNKDGRLSDPASSQLLVLAALDYLGSKQFRSIGSFRCGPGNTRWINYSQGSMPKKRLVIFNSSVIDFSRFCVNRFRSGIKKGCH
jgi:hypothetical protein